MKTYSLVWGDSVCVRQAFLAQIHGGPITFGHNELLEMDYAPFYGDLKLLEETAKVILRQTGLTYKHIFLTNGATGGCTIALRAYQKLGREYLYTNPAPYFPLYPLMAESANLVMNLKQEPAKTVVLLDTPANPTGLHVDIPDWLRLWGVPVVWDSVYGNNVYSALRMVPPKHDCVVGSYSKLTGLNGIRLGYIATNDDLLADKIGPLIASEYCGLSKSSVVILNELLGQFNKDPNYFWGRFEKKARSSLDGNRGQWSKLEKFFDGTEVSPNGMFYYSQMDPSAKRLFGRAGVLWQPGSKCGTTDDFGRFNIGQDQKVVSAAVKAVLKADKI